jgi:hypothetical protein
MVGKGSATVLVASGESETRLRRIIGWKVAAGVTLAAVILGPLILFCYSLMFAHFKDYDDEGYMLLSVKHFLNGWPLYDEIVTFYGPAYYLFSQTAFAFLKLDHDHMRLLTVALWVATAGLAGLCVLGLTHRASLAVLACILTVFHLRYGITSEPGHPQGLVGLLLVSCVAMAAWSGGLPLAVPAVIAGAVAGALAMTKINIGAFATLSLLLVFLCEGSAGRMRRWARAALIAAALLLPTLLLRDRLATSWGLMVAALYTLSIAAVIVTALTDPPTPARPRLLPFLASYAAVVVLLVVYALAHGTTLRGLLGGLFIMPLRLAGANGLHLTLPTRRLWVLAALLSFGLAATRTLRGRLRGPAALLSSDGLLMALKLAFFVIVVSSLQAEEEEYWLRSRAMLYSGCLFLWVALVPPAAPGHRPTRFARVVLCLLAVLQPLQAFPRAGSQIFFGTLLLIPAAVTCLGDVLCYAERRLADRSVPAKVVRAAAPLAAAVAVVVLMACSLWYGSVYKALVPLGTRGAAQIRISERDAATIHWLVANLEPNCDTFLSPIGLNSLYFWADKEPPSRIVIGTDVTIYTKEQQRILTETLDRSPRACVVDHENMLDRYAAVLTVEKPQRQSELLDYVAREFVACGEVDGYTLKVKKGQPAPRLVECARWQGGDDAEGTQNAVVDLTPSPGRAADRISVISVYDRTKLWHIADSRADDPATALAVRLEDGKESVWPLALDGPLRLSLRFAEPVDFEPDEFLIVRLLDRRGQLIKSVPFLSSP